MATNHRGYPVGDNHRPTPRLAQLVARSSTPPSTTEDAQDNLNKYRGYRDMHNDPAYEEMIDEDQNFLKTTFKTRNA